MRLFARIAAGLVIALAWAASASAQTFPSRAVTVLYPYPSPGDLSIRGLMAGVEKVLGQPMVIEIRSGGDEVPMMQALLNAPADGYTIAVPSQNLAINPTVHKLPYELSQFQLMVMYNTFAGPVLVRPDFPAKTIPEFLAYAKANPGKVNAGTVGTLHKFAFLLLDQKAGIKMTQIPYRGGGDVVAAVVGGQIDMMTTNLQTSLALAKEGKVRILATTGPRRMPELPDVPNMGEFVPGWTLVYWQGLVAKAGVPRAVTDRWVGAVREAHKLPEVIKAFQTIANQQMSLGPDEYVQFVRKESENYAAAAKSAGIVPE